MDEQCRNFLKPKCGCTDIVLYIQLGSERLPICTKCWSELATLTVEWDEQGLKCEEKQDPTKQALFMDLDTQQYRHLIREKD